LASSIAALSMVFFFKIVKYTLKVTPHD
jgi:hypothetical protein